MDDTLKEQLLLLTEDQKKNVKKAFFIIVLSSIAAVLIFSLVVCTVYTFVLGDAQHEYNEYVKEEEIAKAQGKIFISDPGRLNEKLDALDAVNHIKDLKIFIPLVILILSCIFHYVILAVFKIKYRYFSFDAYFGLKKLEKGKSNE